MAGQRNRQLIKYVESGNVIPGFSYSSTSGSVSFHCHHSFLVSPSSGSARQTPPQGRIVQAGVAAVSAVHAVSISSGPRMSFTLYTPSFRIALQANKAAHP